MLWRFANRLRALLRSKRGEQELDQELRFHLEQQTEANIAAGMAPEEARRQALVALGGIDKTREEYRDALGFRLLSDLAQDARYALRQMRRNPGFAIAAILSLALGIGANTTIFSIVKAVLLGQLPVREPQRLVSFHTDNGAARLSYPDYLDYRDQVKAFEGVAAFYPVVPASFGGTGEPERLWGQLVTTNYFSVAGAEPPLGRGFMETENKSRVVVISHALWKKSFGGDRTIIGKTALVSGAAYVIVGVAPAGFQGSVRGLATDFWIPLGLYPNVVPMLTRSGGHPEQDHNYTWLSVDARLKPGVSRAEAQAAVQVVARRLDESYPKVNSKRELRLAPAGSLPIARLEVTRLLQLLMAVVALVLLVACANVANLFLAQLAARQREMGVRLAIGAGRGRLVRQLLAESLALSLVGALLGIAVAVGATAAVAKLQTSLPIRTVLDFTVDWRVVLFTAGLSVATAILFGLVPALKTTRPGLTLMLKEESAGFGAFRHFGLRNGLVVAQVALSVVLLAAAALFLRSLQNASSIPLGMKTENVLLLGFDPRATGYSNERAVLLFRELRERVRALPNVSSVTLMDTVPLSLVPHAAGVARPGRPLLRPFAADIYGVTPQYFQTLGIELLRGRDFDEHRGARPPAVINEVIARRLFGSEDPIGQTVNWEGMEHEVIAVARTTKSNTLSERDQPQIYVSLENEYDYFWGLFGTVLAVKARGDPYNLIGPLRYQIHDLEPAMAVYNIETMQEHVNRALLIPRVCGSLFGVFGVTGLSLAAVGLYGVIGYSVARRTREIGIRMAVGARPAAVVTMVVRQGLTLVALGIAVGLALAWPASRVTAGFLFGVSPHDAASFVGVPLLLTGVAVVAVLLPARRAARVDPAVALRQE